MPLSSADYRQFAHDMLNIVGRLQSVTELAEIGDPDLLNLLNTDIQTLTRAIKLFSKLGWCESHPPTNEATDVDVSTLIFEMTSTNRPEGCLLAIDENISLKTHPSVLRAMVEELVYNMQAHGNALEPSKITLQNTSKGCQLQLKNVAVAALPPNPEHLYTKSAQSKGLGLGLPMVCRAAVLLGAGFEFSADGNTVTATLTF